MNLLLVNYEYPPVGGGAANATQFLGRAFSQLGHEVHVLTSGLQEAEGSSREAGINIHRLSVGRRHANRATQREMLSFLFQSRRAVLDLQERHRFSAAIAFFTIPSGPAVLRWHEASGAPYVVSLRGGDVPGHVPGLALKHLVTRPWRRAVLRRAAAIVANSEGLAVTSRRADPFPVRVIPNGVDCEQFHPPPETEIRGRGTAPLRLLFVGRLHAEKNLPMVLEQLAALPENLRRLVEFQIAGDGAQRAQLTALAASLGLESRVRWLGWQEKSSLPNLYRQADALVNPSFYEGMSNVVLEAMASGLPVLASAVPGNEAVVVCGKTGVLFSLQEPAGFRSALVRLVEETAWGRQLGRAGRQRAQTEFSWDRAAQSYLELFAPDRPTSGSP